MFKKRTNWTKKQLELLYSKTEKAQKDKKNKSFPREYWFTISGFLSQKSLGKPRTPDACRMMYNRLVKEIEKAKNTEVTIEKKEDTDKIKNTSDTPNNPEMLTEVLNRIILLEKAITKVETLILNLYKAWNFDPEVEE